MTRATFDQELGSLQSALETMGNKIALTLEETITALGSNDLVLARRIVDDDVIINGMALQLEQNCIDLIARQQPLAQDLRLIVATSKIITDLERIADQCADICGIILRPAGLLQNECLGQITQMFTGASNMLRQAIVAYSGQDAVLAQEVSRQDDAIDTVFADLMLTVSELLAGGRVQADQAVNLILVVKYIERIADHVTNISEWTVFLVSGIYADLNFHDPHKDKYN